GSPCRPCVRLLSEGPIYPPLPGDAGAVPTGSAAIVRSHWVAGRQRTSEALGLGTAETETREACKALRLRRCEMLVRREQRVCLREVRPSLAPAAERE